MSNAPSPPDTHHSRLPWAVAVAAVAFALPFVGYVKDDAWITFRYGRNLAEGLGVVFNPGEAVEGYTNFSWVLGAALAHVVGLSGEEVLWAARAVGLIAAALLGLATWSLARRLGASGTRPAEAAAFAAGLLVATHPTTAVYAMSGLETVAFAALVVGSVERALAGRAHAALWLASLAALTRPEGHVAGLVAAALLLLHARPGARATAALGTLRAGLAPAALLVAYHAWRWAYFGSLVPNTYLVKSSGGALALAGAGELFEVLAVGPSGALVLGSLAAAALVRRASLVAVAAFGWFWLAYLVWVGGDSMVLGRLVLPAWGLLAAPCAALAAAVFARLGRVSAPLSTTRVLAVGVPLALALPSAVELARLHPELSTYHEAMWRTQRQLALDLQDRVPPGSVVAGQDMGLGPYSAPSLRFFDTVGLVSREVAQARAEDGVTLAGVVPRADAPTGERYQRFRARVRQLVFDREPAAIVLVAYLPSPPAAAEVRAPSPAPLAAWLPYLREYAHGLGSDPRLLAGYRLERAYWRSDEYVLLTLLRRDL